jgi:hypothetical protein
MTLLCFSKTASIKRYQLHLPVPYRAARDRFAAKQLPCAWPKFGTRNFA